MPTKPGTPGSRRDMTKPNQAARERNQILAAAKLFDETELPALDQQIADAIKNEHLDEYVGMSIRDIVRDSFCNFRLPTTDGYDEPIVTDLTMGSLYIDAAISTILDWSEKYDIPTGSVTHKLIVRAVEAACSYFDQHPELEKELTAEFVERARRALTNPNGFIGPKLPLIMPKRPASADVNTYTKDGQLKVVHFEAPTTEELTAKIREFLLGKPPESEQDRIRREFDEQQAQLKKSRDE